MDNLRLSGTVELDETLVTKRKYNRGRMPKWQIWLFGFYQRQRKSQFFAQYPIENKKYYIGLLKNILIKKKTLITDDYSVYIDNKVLPKQSKITAAFKNISHRW